MQTGDRGPAPEDVEKLQEQLVEIRAHRRRVEEEFDAFTRGFRTGQPPPRALLPPSPIGRGRTRAAGGFVGVPVEAPAETPPPAHSVPQALADSPRAPRAPRRANGRTLAVAGIAVVVVAVAAIAVRDRFSQPDVGTPVTVQPAPSAAQPTPAPAPAPTSATPTAQAVTAGVNVTAITRRRVWMRVTVDGQRAFEREVGAGEQIPLRGDRSIVIRAGDASAVAVIWNGRDAGTVGRDGVVATREFTRDAPPR